MKARIFQSFSTRWKIFHDGFGRKIDRQGRRWQMRLQLAVPRPRWPQTARPWSTSRPKSSGNNRRPSSTGTRLQIRQKVRVFPPVKYFKRFLCTQKFNNPKFESRYQENHGATIKLGPVYGNALRLLQNA